jgi:hypothetical protein
MEFGGNLCVMTVEKKSLLGWLLSGFRHVVPPL